MRDMPRVRQILRDEAYQSYLAKNEKAEKNRVYCRHDMTHLLDVCRVGYAMILEDGLPYTKELMYTAGLLHDIGRWVQVETKADHAKAGAEMAAPILKRCGFSDEESALVVQAILYHRIKEHPDAFSKVLYDADKQSRPCFACPEIGSCKRFANGETAELKY